MVGANEEALQEKKAKFNRLVDNMITADLINEFSLEQGRMQRSTSRPRDLREEVWAIRADVTKLRKQRRDENEKYRKKSSITSNVGGPEQNYRLEKDSQGKSAASQSTLRWAKKRHEKNRHLSRLPTK